MVNAEQVEALTCKLKTCREFFPYNELLNRHLFISGHGELIEQQKKKENGQTSTNN